MEPIIFLDDCKDVYYELTKDVIYDKMVNSSYAPDRLEAWYGYSSNLQSVKDGRSEVKWNQAFPIWLEELRKKYFPSSDSCLVCKGEKIESDTSIEWHRDHGNFENKVVMINFGEAKFFLQTYDAGTIITDLQNCQVVEFDSKLLHKSKQLSTNRYILTSRKVKKEFLRTKLF